MTTISSLGIGSGLDLNGLLDQLRDAERGKLEPLKLQKASQQARLSAYGTLSGALSAFQSAAAKLNDAQLYRSVSSNVTGSSVEAAAGAQAVPGRYDVSVAQLARSQSIATGGFAEDATFGGDMGIVVGTGDRQETLAFSVAAGSSLAEVRDAINAQQGGVTASIVNDGDPDAPFRLVLSSSETGTDAAIQSVSLSGDAGFDFALDGGDGSPAGSMTQTVEARNALLTVNGIAITSQKNQVEDAIQGVTLNIAEEGESTVKVELNNREMREAVTHFVKAYNDLQRTTGELTRFNAETGAAGELLGDSALRSIESRLRGVLTGGVGEGEFRMLSDIGIALQRGGTLELDEKRLDEVIVNDRQALTAFFAGEDKAGGLAGRLDQTLDEILKDRGLLDNAKRGLETRLGSLDERYARMEKSIEATISRYRTQFGQLDAMIASMNQTSDYLTQQFDMMNAQLGRKK
ncbi:flagellar filament capping protein FliD [Halomonas heilongjiangensis]|uniref:Flagellar hook-associated protein 2 n=1 Tax=Halomonas heilongjiangensis TaxID=1387883 RepID=A0A2N7TMP4_9GAMM|nr:flagellar filament capping protein FliD [Halomonas heilongjiangensis]PMR69398.1 flagellar filament capping protein FliD [Halomonas heilongjiangensis]PXX92892.1 flagellar filament capping protein FliD [Halomonas heilongjiangensis]